MGNEESAQLLQGAGAGQTDFRQLPSNMISTMSSNLAGKTANATQSANSMLNSIGGQLSNSFPNSIRPMNQLINQLNPGSFPGMAGGGPRTSGPGPPRHPGPSGPQGPPGPPNAMPPSGGAVSNPQPAPVPDVDLSGLTEEEKQMIQSVMARAQEETGPGQASPSVKPQSASMINSAPNTSFSSSPRPEHQMNHMSQAQTSQPAPMIGYPEQRRMLKNVSSCYMCRRDLEPNNAIKCADCPKVFCAQCGRNVCDPNSQGPVWYCAECAKQRQTLPLSLVPPAAAAPSSSAPMAISSAAPSVLATGNGSGLVSVPSSQPYSQMGLPSGTQMSQPISSSMHSQQQPSQTNPSNIYSTQQQFQQQPQSTQQQQQQPSMQSANPQQNLMQRDPSLSGPQSHVTQPQMTDMSQQQSFDQSGSYQGNTNQQYFDSNYTNLNQVGSDMQQQQPLQQQQPQPQQTMGQFVNPATGLQTNSVNSGAMQQQQYGGQMQSQPTSNMPDSAVMNKQNDPFAPLNFPPPGNPQQQHQQQQQQQNQQHTKLLQQSNQFNTQINQQQANQQNQAMLSSGGPMTNQSLIDSMTGTNQMNVAQANSGLYGQMGPLMNNAAPNAMSSGAGKLQSTVPSTELDEYGYLDFDIDEEYERQGEYDDEDREDEEEEEDDEEDDEDYERLARMGVITRPERDHRALPPQHTQSGGKVRVSAPPTGYHHLYSGYHGTINNNTVYTIPEEDEEHDMDANEEFQGVETSKKRSERKSSVSSSANSGLGGPMGTKSGKVVRGSEGTQRLLPSTAGPGGGRQCSSANPSPCSTPAKARNYRSNSEPFLEIARPLKRGGSGYPPNQPAMAQQKLFQQPPTQSQQHMQPKMMQGEAMMQANQAWSSQDLMGIRPPQNPQQGQLQQQQQQQQPQPRPPFGPNVTNQNLERDMYMLQQDISMTNRRSSLDNSMQLAMSTNKPFNNYGPQPPMNNGIINQMQQANLGYIPNSMGNKMQQDAMQYTMQMNQQPRLPHQTSLPVQFDQYKQQQQQNQLTTNQLNQTLQQQQQLQQQQPFGMNYQQQIEQAQRQSDPIRSQTSLDQKQMDKITISQHQSYPISIPRSMPLYNMSNQLTSQTQAQTQSGQMGSMGQSMMGSQVNVQVSNVASNVSLMPTSSTGRTTQVLQSQTNQTLAPTSQRNYPQQQLLQPNSAKNLQQFQDNTWPHSTELSPILDVSPSVEAAEAQEIQGNNRRTSLDKTSNNTNIPRAISGMIDDFNKAIENLSLTNNVDDPKYLRGSSLQNQENKNDSQPKKLSITATKSPLQGRRASTGQVDNLDHYERRQHSSPRHQSPQSRLQVNSKTNLETSLVSQTTNQDLESLRQHKVLLSGNSQIAEQQLQKQQQILIQQQQQFLQIQLEQQRIQTQIQEQMSSSAKQEQQLPHQSQVPSVQTRTESTKSTVAGARRVATSEANREIAVNTEPERMRDKAVSTVMKQDKQVSTSFTPPPSSLTSTPTGPITRYAPTVSSSRTLGGVESESTRTRVISASSTSSQHRRLPPSEETYYSASGQSHSSRPSSSVTSISQRSTSPQIGTRKPAVIRNIMPTGKSAVTFNRGCLAKPKEPTSVVKSTHQVQSFNTLGYLDLDTKNVTFDTGKTKRRKLPTAPQEDEPISSMLATKKLIKEKLSSVGRNVARNPLKSSSSLDSSFGIGPSAAAYMSKRPVSPFSSNSDITNFLASTYGRNLLKSPTSTNLADVLRAKDQRTNAGSQMSKSSLDEKLLSSCNFANEIKTIQQKIMEELKTSDPSTLLPSDLNAALLNAPSTSLTSLTQPSKYQVTKTPYDNLELLARNRRDMLKDAQLGKLDMVASRLKFPINSNANLPFKSYEYESLNPVRYSDNKYRLTRPMSSVSFYENDLGLRESSIPNCMNEDELLLRSQLLNSKRRFDGDILAGSKYDRYHSLYSKYDLAGPGLTGQRFGRGARTDLLYGGRDYRNTSRSWHPSPYVSDVSDEEDLEHELSVEEKTAKVRAEIKRRRQRLADSGRLYRHYSFDDYNVLGEYDSELDPLTTPYNPSHRDPYGKYNKYVPSEYPLVGSKEKYYSDDLDAYYPKSGYHGYSEYPTSRHNTRLYDSRLASQNYGYADEYYTSGGVTGTGAGGASSMPLLTDTTSRSRKMIDDLGTGVAGVNGYRAGYDHNYDYNYMRGSPKKTQFAPNTTKHPKYPFPIKRILLTQDPKIRSMSGDSLGLKVVGGKEIPGTNMIGAYIQRIHPSLSMNGEIREGMQVIEWNGIPLTGIAHDEVSRIIANQIGDEIEVVIRTDINLLQGQYHNQYHPGHGQPVAGGPPYGPNPGHYSGQAYYGPEAGMPPPHGVGPGVPPNSGPYYQGHYGGHGPPPPQASMHSGAPGPMHPSVRPGLGPVPQSTMQPVSQPQVILQHNHPVDDSIMYDQYGKMMHPPGPPMAPGGPGTQGGPPPGPMGMPPPGHHHPMMHQHPGGPPPGQIMAPPPTHHHNPMDAPYYPH